MEQVPPWGKSMALDLHGCDHDRLTSGELLKEFVPAVIDMIGMTSHGPCYVDRFGEGEIEGFSAMQFLKTSTITVHLDEVRNRAFIDVFSCKEFDTDQAIEYAKKFFGATEHKVTVLSR